MTLFSTKRNVLICGESGIGKRHLAHELGQEAARQGLSVIFVVTDKMLMHLAAGRADRSVERRLKSYLRPQLLILDDFGLKTIPQPFGAEELYEVINSRYVVGSLVITSNRAYEEWPSWWGNPLLVSAGLDRLGHIAESASSGAAVTGAGAAVTGARMRTVHRRKRKANRGAAAAT